jgi:hypothetical protein
MIETKILLMLLLVLVTVIILYWVYLVLTKNNSSIEGFENEIELLIQTKPSRNFNKRIWDNSAYLQQIYNKQSKSVPNDLKQCITVNNNSNILSQCPISIWRPTTDAVYKSIGDVLTRLNGTPYNEIVKDARKPKTPGAITDISLETMNVSGSVLKEPEDFAYVGGFGKGELLNVNIKDDNYNRLITIIKSNYSLLGKSITQSVSDFIKNKLKGANDLSKQAFADQLFKISVSFGVQPMDQSTINNFKVIYNKYIPDKSLFAKKNNTKSNVDPNELLIFINKEKNVTFTPISKTKIQYEIVKIDVNEKLPFSKEEIFSNVPPALMENINKIIKDVNFPDTIQYSYYKFIFKNLNIIPTNKSALCNNGCVQEGGFFSKSTNYKADKVHIIGLKSGYHLSNGHYAYTKYHHNILPTHPSFDTNNYLEATIDYKLYYQSEKTVRQTDTIYTSSDVYTSNWKYIYDENPKEPNCSKSIIAFHMPNKWWEHPFIQDIYSYEITINRERLSDLSKEIAANTNPIPTPKTSTSTTPSPILANVDYYSNLVSQINDFVTTIQNPVNNDYFALSIWQPIPPPGYVALGCVFMNADSTVKPTTDLISCVPQTCVKSFKRRPWLPEDLVFKYTDATQSLAFYRNPYLNTVIVLDEIRDGNKFKNQMPDQMKYRNEAESLNWECFDIVPCIKEDEYINNLVESTKKSKQLCRASTKLENQYIEEDETKKTNKMEEEKMKKLVVDKGNYINGLMKQLDELMNAEELYKMINRGLNRFRMKKDLETQRKLHEQVADKMMKTRGFEIGFDDPSQFDKFKGILNQYVVSKATKPPTELAPPKNCPVCRIPDTDEFVEISKLKMCYGCVENVVRELIDTRRLAGEPIPPELKALEDRMNAQ